MIESTARTLRVVASAGSGKTQTIVERIAHQIRGGLDPCRLLVLTFDAGAARSLRERLAARVGGAGGPPVATLNAFAYRLLRRWVPREHRPIAPRQVRENLLQGVIEALGRKSALHRSALVAGERSYEGLFSLFKNALFDPRAPTEPTLAGFILESSHAAPFLPMTRDRALLERSVQALIWLFTAHEHAMGQNGWMDFDDQKLRAWVALRGNGGLRQRVERRYSEVIVDEFQDINRLDFELIRIIARRSRLLLAGDDDQAIYGFRGCTPDFILDPQGHLKRAVASYELQTNYRNAPNLMRQAERLISHNRRRIPKHPVPHRRDKATITVHEAASPEAEAGMVVADIERQLGENPALRPRDVAVLYRMHVQSLPLRAALCAAAIPYTVQDRGDFPGDETAGDLGDEGGLRNGVELLTCFKAKGLQWDTVFLIGCNAGLIPHPRAPVEEERRLFYVAMTRAIAHLRISYIAPFDTGEGAPSPFLAEAGLVK
ncbi:MAG: ATP-dependent helicase [Gemmatimonadetes bacterium]|nr:ATP-dependent helicase [Gemmatimonadota bacterium]